MSCTRCREETTTIDPDSARFKLFEYGFQYYIAARFAARSTLTLVVGPLFHHAVELLLKAQLVRRQPLEALAKKYYHGLLKLWADFKAEFPEQDLSPFDQVVADLDPWWDIRYPDDLLVNGGGLEIGWSSAAVTTRDRNTAPGPRYTLNVRDLDKFVARLIKLISVNATAFTSMIRDEGRAVATYENPEAKAWFDPPSI